MSAAYNIAVIGQTGVGKSSLINYLFGEEVCKTGIGKPVTTNGFHVVKHHIQDMPVNIYDSWGLEVGKEAQWLKELDAELQKRGIDKNATEWFHSVFYCISASGARIQDADVKTIKHLLEAKYKVSLILTRTDELNEEQEEEFKKAIQDVLKHSFKTALPIIPVCSTRKKLRGNQNYSEPFGKEEVEKQSIIDFVDSLILRIPAHCESVMKKELEDWQDNMKWVIRNKMEAMGFNSNDIKNRLSKESKQIVKDIFDKGETAKKAAVQHYSYIAQHFENQIKLYGKENHSNPHIDEAYTSDFEWYDIFIIPFTPLALIYMAFSGKNDAINDLLKELQEFVDKVDKKIGERVKELESSFKAIQTKLRDDSSING